MEHLKLILLLFSLTVFSTYTIVISLKYGVQKSISESYYRLSDKAKPWFTLTLWGFAIPIMIISETGLMFFATGGICFVAVAANFKGWVTERNVHMVGALGGIFLAMLSMIIDFNLWYIPSLFVAIITIISLTDIKNKLWWIETSAFYLILLGLTFASTNW
jgi:hypothetical protein